MIRKFIMALALAGLTIASSARAAGTDDAKQFVDSIGTRVLAIVNASGGSEAQHQQQLQELFAQNVDIAWMGQFVLGHGWQQATPEQRTSYLAAYKDFLLAHYTANFTNYTGAKYTVTDVKNAADGQFLVNMQIKTSQQAQDTSAGYRLRSEGNAQFKIIDIIIEGVSLLTTQRSDFASVIQSGGIDALISDLKNKMQTDKPKS